jgi:biotin operon repressor
VLLALDDGRALPASVLADEAGISRSTASSHLGKLTEAGLLAVEARGRHRYYRLAGPAVAELIEALQRLAPVAPVRSLRQGTRARALREARTCYDHVAGRLGVALMAALIDKGHLTGGDGTYDPALTDARAGYGHEIDYRLSPSGTDFLAEFGVRVPPHRRLMRYCVDWSEQRHHLAGGLGRGLLDRLQELDWIRRTEASRALLITGSGRDGLRATFGVDLS